MLTSPAVPPSTRLAPTRCSALRLLLAQGRPARAEEPYPLLDAGQPLLTYLSHGVLNVAEALAVLNDRYGLTLNEHIGQSLLRFEYTQHIWRHRGDGLLNDIQKRPSSIRYQDCVPNDLAMAATGVAAIDEAVRTLYRTGTLRLCEQQWLAAYAIHLRKVDWRAGMRWLHGHLRHADLASLCLEWQRIAGTMGSAPVVFNADAMREAGSAPMGVCQLDQPLEALQALADSTESIAPEAVRPLPLRAPRLLQHPPAPVSHLPTVLPRLAGLDVTLMHPWALRPPSHEGPVIGIIHLPFHLRFPWSEARWDFVLRGMERHCDALWIGDLANCRQWLAEARTVSCLETRYPGYREALDLAGISSFASNGAIPEPGLLCAAFEIYLQAVRRQRPALFASSLKGQVARLQQQR